MNFKNYELLDIVEEFASSNNLISSEDELSERFDEEVLPYVIECYGEDDEPAINEAFSNWMDSLCKEGELHEEQYNQYEYVGRLSYTG